MINKLCNCKSFIKLRKTHSEYSFDFFPHYKFRGYCEKLYDRRFIRFIGINLPRYEEIRDIYSTIQHEGIHSCFYELEVELTIKQEHAAILKVAWNKEYY